MLLKYMWHSDYVFQIHLAEWNLFLTLWRNSLVDIVNGASVPKLVCGCTVLEIVMCDRNVDRYLFVSNGLSHLEF